MLLSVSETGTWEVWERLFSAKLTANEFSYAEKQAALSD